MRTNPLDEMSARLEIGETHALARSASEPALQTVAIVIKTRKDWRSKDERK